MARSCVGDVSLTTFLISSLASQTRLHNHRDRPCGHPEQTRSAADHTTSSVPSNPAQPTTPPPSTNERHSTFERDFKPSTPPTTPRTLTCTTKCLSLSAPSSAHSSPFPAPPRLVPQPRHRSTPDNPSSTPSTPHTQQHRTAAPSFSKEHLHPHWPRTTDTLVRAPNLRASSSSSHPDEHEVAP